MVRAQRKIDAIIRRGGLKISPEFSDGRLRSASPHALLILAPNGACTTSCMPPASSKNRSATMRAAGAVPRTRFPSSM